MRRARQLSEKFKSSLEWNLLNYSIYYKELLAKTVTFEPANGAMLKYFVSKKYYCEVSFISIAGSRNSYNLFKLAFWPARSSVVSLLRMFLQNIKTTIIGISSMFVA